MHMIVALVSYKDYYRATRDFRSRKVKERHYEQRIENS
jgi:hypothetical protein